MDDWLRIPKDRPRPHPVRWSLTLGMFILLLLIRYGRVVD